MGESTVAVDPERDLGPLALAVVSAPEVARGLDPPPLTLWLMPTPCPCPDPEPLVVPIELELDPAPPLATP